MKERERERRKTILAAGNAVSSRETRNNKKHFKMDREIYNDVLYTQGLHVGGN
jgi:hypothetical protein